MALVAARAADAGASGADALAAVERARETLKMWFAIDTLEYLRKGGRIGSAQAWLGSALQIKPILTLEEEITPGRAGAHPPARVRAHGRVRARAQATPAPAPGWCSTSTTPTRPASWSTRAARSSAPSRSSSPRSAR